LLRYFEDDYFGKINVESILYNPAVALNVPYQDLVIPEFVDRFSSCPELMIACLNVAASQAIHHMRVQQNIVPPEQDLPVSVHITRYPVRTWLKDLKSNLVSKFISIQGNVIRVSSMKPLLRQMVFSCRACSKSFSMSFSDGKVFACANL
jgi:DNA replicative helicase MCM subunit Mcm2 (Cdc46/Mcm family)